MNNKRGQGKIEAILLLLGVLLILALALPGITEKTRFIKKVGDEAFPRQSGQ